MFGAYSFGSIGFAFPYQTNALLTLGAIAVTITLLNNESSSTILRNESNAVIDVNNPEDTIL